VASEWFYYRDALEAAAINESRERGCLGCRQRERDKKSGLFRCLAQSKHFPYGTKQTCRFYIRRKPNAQ